MLLSNMENMILWEDIQISQVIKYKNAKTLNQFLMILIESVEYSLPGVIKRSTRNHLLLQVVLIQMKWKLSDKE